MLRYLFMRRHTWNCSTRQSTQDGIWHILLFFLVYDKYKEIKMYLVVQVILHVHTCTWFPTTKINHKKVDVILKSALGMKCSGKNITIQQIMSKSYLTYLKKHLIWYEGYYWIILCKIHSLKSLKSHKQYSE